MLSIGRLVKSFWFLAVGIVIGGIFLEAILQVNPRLLLRGMAVPMPVDPPLTVTEYDVFTSDADVFYWHREVIQPIPTEEDVLEAHVRFETDEFGFPNPAPVPAEVDMIILGRSYSLGAQAANPYPRQLASLTHLQVLNLSQTGSGMDTKISYMNKFGWIRKPRWIVIEVLPSMDILGYAPPSRSLVETLPSPIIRAFWKPVEESVSVAPANPVYPLKVNIADRQVSLTFFSLYLSALTADQDAIHASNQWRAYTEHLLNFSEVAKSQSACIILLYVPTKENLYFSLAADINQLAPLSSQITPWKLDATGNLYPDSSAPVSISDMRANAHAVRDLLSDFAEQNGLYLVDPTARLEDAILNNTAPYMQYDTHWSDVGHTLIAEMIAETVDHTCP